MTTNSMISRTERGLSINGTRITLYDVMSYLKADWPPSLIKNWLNLDENQLEAALSYIDDYRAEVEAEYQQVLQAARDSREYWESRNQDQLASIATLPAKPGTEKLRAKILASKIELGLN